MSEENNVSNLPLRASRIQDTFSFCSRRYIKDSHRKKSVTLVRIHRTKLVILYPEGLDWIKNEGLRHHNVNCFVGKCILNARLGR